jgi:hypothetical protein
VSEPVLVAAGPVLPQETESDLERQWLGHPRGLAHHAAQRDVETTMLLGATGDRLLREYPARQESRPRWSPDGTRIAFLATAGETATLCLLSRDGQRTPLTGPGLDVAAFAWSRSPDGGTLAYVYTAAGAGGPTWPRVDGQGLAAPAVRLALWDLGSGRSRDLRAVTAERTAAVAAPSDEQLTEALVEDFSRAAALSRAVLARDGRPPVEERTLNLAAYQLLRSGRAAEALQAFQLNAEAFPQSPNVYDSLADAYEATGQPQQALELTRKVLDMLSRDQQTPEARRRLIQQSAEQRIARLQAAAAKTP